MNVIEEIKEGQRIYTVTQGSDPIGYVVIDSTFRGHSHGGFRMSPNIEESEIRRLARTMTLKFAFLGLPQGGAKAGLLGDPEAPQPERWSRLISFGQAIAPLLNNRTYIPYPDMGIVGVDILHMLKSIGLRVYNYEYRDTPTGYYTALSVFISAKIASDHIGLPLSECSVAIEGFGKVGCSLANLLSEAKARIVAISTSRGAIFNPQGLDVKRLLQLANQSGSRVINLDEDAMRFDCASLLELPVDLLCLCARHDTIHTGNAPRIKARIVCPGANNPVTPEAEHILFERKILCLPDFVINCGGVLGGTMEFTSIRSKRIKSFIEHYLGKHVSWLLDESAQRQILPREIAMSCALRRLEQLPKNFINSTPFTHLFEAAIKLYRCGWLPRSLVAALSLNYFKKLLNRPSVYFHRMESTDLEH